ERRTAEEANLCEVRGAKTRFAALAFNRFDHRRFFAADVRARASSKMESWNPARRGFQKAVELALQNGAAAVILVAQVDINVIDPHRPARNDRTLEKPVRVAFEVVAVLERPRLAFVDVDRQEPRRRFRGDYSPLSARGKAGAA